jgi:hypothetical protein
VSETDLVKLRKRVRAARAADLVRRYEYRQRNHARGAWFRLRRLLSQAATAWRISAEDAQSLREEGVEPEAVGFEIEPNLMILTVPEERLGAIQSREPLPVRLSAELLRAGHLALVLWPEERRPESTP